MRRPLSVLVTVLVLAGLAACGRATGPPSVTSAATSSTAAATPSPTAEPPPDEVTAVFLGDSYTVGVGGSGYVERTAARLGWTAVAEGESGTGYLAPSTVPGQTVYAGRLPDVVAADPDVVVVQGSTNDVGQPPELVGAAAAALYAELRSAVPGARVVVLGPLAAPGVARPQVDEVRDALARAASGAGVPFVDPIAAGWLTPGDGLFADAVHPNDSGYGRLADDLAQALEQAGF